MGYFCLDPFMGGSVTGTITSIDVDSTAAPDTVQMFTIGNYGGVKDTVINVLTTNLSITAPTITGGMAISNGSAATVKSSGKDTTDGHNYNLAGTALDGSCADANGLTYGSPAPTITHSGTWSITGAGATPDTQAIPTQPNYDALALQLAGVADSTINWNVSGGGVHQYGDVNNPKIIVFKAPGGTASGTVAGDGVLIMDLRNATVNMQFSGTLTWTGLVIVIGSPAGFEAKWSNALPLTGALLLTGTTPKFETSNNLKIHYSCAAINMAFSSPKLLGNYIIADWWE